MHSMDHMGDIGGLWKRENHSEHIFWNTERKDELLGVIADSELVEPIALAEKWAGAASEEVMTRMIENDILSFYHQFYDIQRWPHSFSTKNIIESSTSKKLVRS